VEVFPQKVVSSLTDRGQSTKLEITPGLWYRIVVRIERGFIGLARSIVLGIQKFLLHAKGDEKAFC